MRFDLVIAVDWSSEQGRKPTPQENRCWLAWGLRDGQRGEPEYMPTRLEAETRIHEILDRNPGARALVGFDFAIGYPLSDDGAPVLPAGRALCALADELVTDDASGVNNRFAAAGDLNERVRAVTGRNHGPFWGRPASPHVEGLPTTRPSGTGVRKLRDAEVAARKQSKTKPKSAWQLAGIGSVGGQSLTGLKYVHRLLTALGERGRLWPFEAIDDRDDAVVIAEIYPSLFPQRSPAYWYKDARQVVDTRDAILDAETQSLLAAPNGTLEGWILGVAPTTSTPAGS